MGGDSVWPDLSGISFPIPGREAARLTLGGWRIHPLGVVSRDRFLAAARTVAVDSYNSDELVTRKLFASLRQVSHTSKAYYYVKNPDSTTLRAEPDLRHLARSQAWLLDFAREQGLLELDPLLAHTMTRKGLWLADRVTDLYPTEPIGQLLEAIRLACPKPWRLGSKQGLRTLARRVVGRGDGRRLRALRRRAESTREGEPRAD